MTELKARKQMLDAMAALNSGTVALDAVADELVRTAADLSDASEASLMQEAARCYRVKILELRSRLAAVRSNYAARFCAEP